MSLRKWILTFSLILSLLLVGIVLVLVPLGGPLPLIRLEQTYGFVSFIFLYLTLLVSPLSYAFPKLLHRPLFFRSRRALGLSAFYFGLLHAVLAFFGQLQGFGGLAFLALPYLVGVCLGAFALLILTLMAATAFDAAVKKMGLRRWKILHRFIYLGGTLLLIHIALLGTHYENLTSDLGVLTFLALAFLMALQAYRLDGWLARRRGLGRRFGAAFFGATALWSGYGTWLFTSGSPTFGAHGNHGAPTVSSASGGVVFDHHGNPLPASLFSVKHVSLNLETTPEPEAGQSVELKFHVFDADSGSPLQSFDLLHGVLMHLVVVNAGLSWFAHVHPVWDGANGFTLPFTFPAPGAYRLYAEIQPSQAGYEVEATSVSVPGVLAKFDTPSPVDAFGAQKIFHGHRFRLDRNKAGLILDLKTDRDGTVPEVTQWLQAWGHMVMIDESSHAYRHLHAETPPVPWDDLSGRGLRLFFPQNLAQPTPAGVYRIFVQVQVGTDLILTDWTIGTSGDTF